MRDRDCRARRLFFKLDIEGYEYRALLGMRQTLAAAEEAVGFVEFDAHMLANAGEDVTAYWRFVREHFSVYAFSRSNTWLPANDWDLAQLKQFIGRHCHTDLVLIKSNDPSLADRLLAPWPRATDPRVAAVARQAA